MKTLGRTFLGTATAVALTGVLAGGAAPAEPTPPPPELAQPTSLSDIRQETVERARQLLARPQDYQAVTGGIVRESRPVGDRNYLEWKGSNSNRNEFNDFNGDAWCGYFAARAWTGKNTPSLVLYPRIPKNYPSSQAWRTESGDRYHRFSRDRLPRRGDVLIWQDGPGRPGQVTSVWSGHVGVVVKVDPEAKTVVSIEGNVLGDEIAERSYAWDANGPTLEGKHFMGFTSRD